MNLFALRNVIGYRTRYRMERQAAILILNAERTLGTRNSGPLHAYAFKMDTENVED